MKKKLYIMLGVIAALMLTVAATTLLKEEKEVRLVTGVAILDTHFQSVKDIPENDVIEHLNEASKIFLGKSYSKFSESEMLTIGILNMRNETKQSENNITLDREKLTAYIKYYFGSSEFEITSAPYTLIGYGEIDLVNEADLNIEIPATGLEWDKKNEFLKIEEVNDQSLIVHYDYQQWIFEGPALDGHFQSTGKAKLYLNLEDGYLSLQKIEFSLNEDN